MRKKTLLFILIAGISFIVGIIISPYLQETTYTLKKWVQKPRTSPVPGKLVRLYFCLPESEILVPVERKILINGNINQQIKRVLEELIKGPGQADLAPTLPPQTRIRAVYTRKDTIFVDFSSSVVENHPGGTSAELVSIYSVVNTLIDNFPPYSKVQILLEGKPQNTLAGHIDLRQPFTRRGEIIKEKK